MRSLVYLLLPLLAFLSIAPSLVSNVSLSSHSSISLPVSLSRLVHYFFVLSAFRLSVLSQSLLSAFPIRSNTPNIMYL